MPVSVRIGQTIWLTKFALNEGIVTAKVERRYDDHKGVTTVRITGRYHWYRLGKDVHLTRDLAVERACAMREARLKTLQKQYDKISAMEF